MKFIKAISSTLSWVERSLIVIMLGVMIVLAFAQVILRNVFATGFLWADPLLRHMVMWIGFLGASLATQQEKHINLDIVTRFTSPRFKNIIRTATSLFAVIVTSFLTKAGWVFLQNEISSGDILITIGKIDCPAWWFQLIIPIGFGLMAFRFLLRTVEHLLATSQPTPSVRPPTNVPTIEV